ncbi:MAG: hypothetical protein WED10_09770 [Brumimicrobium sp.]
MKFYPSYYSYSCENDRKIYTQQSGSLFIELNGVLIKENGNWVLTNIALSDDTFEVNKDKHPCIYYKYNKLSN